MPLKLYGFKKSTNTQRVLIALKETNVPYEFINIDILKGEGKTPDYLKIQPYGLVPALVTEDGFTLFESRAIFKLIAHKTKGLHALIPSDDDYKGWALFEQALSLEQANFDVPGVSIASEKVFKPLFGGQTDEVVLAKHVETMNAKMDVLEQLLSQRKFLAGDKVTFADLSFLPYGGFLTKVGYDFVTNSKRPHVARWWKEISSRPAWAAVQKEVSS